MANFALCEVSRQAKFRSMGLTYGVATRENAAMPKQANNLYVHLRAWRKYAGMTQEHIANIVGVKFNTVSGWETGKRAVDLEDLDKLAKIYGVHPAALLFAPPGGAEFEAIRQAVGVLEELNPEQAQLWLGVGAAMRKDGDK